MKPNTHPHSRTLLALAAVVALIVSALPSLAAKQKKDKSPAPSWEAGADSRKADYYYMEALRQNALDNGDAYFELLQRAWEMDSTDTSVGQKLGYLYMLLGAKDSAMSAKGFGMMRHHFDRQPGDYNSSVFYGIINQRLGNLGEAVRVWATLDSLFPGKPEITLNLADALQAVADTASMRRSLGVLARLERSQGPDLPFTARKVRAKFALADTAGAIDEVRALMAASPRSSNFSVYAGDMFSALEQPDSALFYYDRACRIDSTNGVAFYNRAEFFRERGDSAAFDREVFQALRRESLDLDVKLEMLTNYVRQLYTDSLQRPRINQLFETLLEQNPHESQIRDLYSSYFVAVNDYLSAAEQQRVALDTDPSEEERWRATMSLYTSADSLQRAIQTGIDALRYFPESPLVNLMIGANYQQLENYDEALRYFAVADSLTDSADVKMRSQIVASTGDIYYARNQPDEAFLQYNLALELDPENIMAMNNCAYYLSEQNRDLDRAERLSAMCVADAPDNDTYLDTYAWIFFKKKDYAKAREMIDRALAVDPDHPQAEELHHAGDIYYFLGEPAQALDFWTRALKLDPDNRLLQKKVKNKTHFFE